MLCVRALRATSRRLDQAEGATKEGPVRWTLTAIDDAATQRYENHVVGPEGIWTRISVEFTLKYFDTDIR